MRKMEQNNQYLPKPKDDDPNSFKTRKGKVEGHKEYLSQEDIRLIDQYLAENLDDLYAQYKRSPR